MCNIFSSLVCLLFIVQIGYAQDEIIPMPQKSPLEKIETEVGIIEMSIEYSRPAMRGREIFGGLVPYEEVWRTGANINTRITFSGPVIIGETKIEAGAYSIFTIPGPGEWEVIFHKELNDYGKPESVLPENIIGQITVPSMKTDRVLESFSITFEDLRNDGCNLVLAWDNVFIKVPIKVSTPTILSTSLEQSLQQTTNAYAYAASNYLRIAKDPESALKSIDFALALKEKDQTFLEWLSKVDPENWAAPWFYQLKGEIHAELGQYKEAITAANRSLEVCAKLNDANYSIKRNTENIAKWTK